MKNFAEMTPERLAAYRECVAVLNDQMRAKLDSPAPNIVVMTQGILALVDSNPAIAIARQLELMFIVSTYSAFSEDNNPHGERDFGDFEWRGTRCYWKIDLYEDPDVKSANDPPAITRVITIMLPSDY